MKTISYGFILIAFLASCRENLVDPGDEQKRNDIVGLWIRTKSSPPSPSSTTLHFYRDSVRINVTFPSNPERDLNSVYNYSINQSTISYYSLDLDNSFIFEGENFIESLDRHELILSFPENNNKVVQTFERNSR